MSLWIKKSKSIKIPSSKEEHLKLNRIIVPTSCPVLEAKSQQQSQVISKPQTRLSRKEGSKLKNRV